MKKFFGLITALTLGFTTVAQNGDHEHDAHDTAEHHEEGEFNAAEHAVHHAKDAHEIHFADGFVVPLPVILWTDNGLVTFMSSEFHHDDAGQVVVEKEGMKFVKFHEKIYMLNDGESHFEVDHATHEAINATEVKLDFSLTKNVVSIFLIAILLILVFFSSAKKYKKDKPSAPSGIASWTEPVVLFVRDVAKENIEGDKYKKFTPYLLSVFFFILFGNLLGLIPFLANPNVTGSISITLLLATFTFAIQMINSKKTYWAHIFDPLGKSMSWGGKLPLYIILVPIEILGIFIKPAALLIRLFANITAGHIIVVSLISIIFVNESIAWAGLSVPFTLFISTLEILVAFLQAYIFMMLSALFIGMAVETAHH
ncbi:MAG: F0F1 ATP synthase subunit A [Crocinitomicaceae bacterium]|nr:F0F1 ATP synthase subunit A [Crocinitomicaceae bacterium]